MQESASLLCECTMHSKAALCRGFSSSVPESVMNGVASDFGSISGEAFVAAGFFSSAEPKLTFFRD